MSLADILANKRNNLNHVDESEQHIVEEFYEEDDLPIELYPGLFIGGIKCARRGHFLLNEYGISNILTVCHEESPCKVDGIQYFDYPIWDKQTEELLTILEDTHKVIDNILEKNEKILVHCMGGISRSGSVCISYIMNKNNDTFLNTWRECKKKRSVIHPNEGFKIQLTKFEQYIKNKTKNI